MNKPNPLYLFVVVGLLILTAIASRFLLLDWPNFKPVFAIAIFLGFYCHSRWLSAIAMIGAMLVSDFAIGFYELPLMVTVYGTLMVAIAMGSWLQHQFLNHSSWSARVCRFIGVTLGTSILFFVATNAATSLFMPWYPATFDGVVTSLLAGVPFFKFTVAGDLLFGSLLFSIYFAMQASLAPSVAAGRRIASAVN